MIKWELRAEALQAKFKELGRNSPAVLSALNAYARVVRTRIQVAFRQSKSPWGKPWKPLNPVLTRSGQPLVNTRRLYSSVGVRREADGIVIGTNLKTPEGGHNLGAIHQFGAEIFPKEGKYLAWTPAGAKGMVFAESVTIPARPFMPIAPSGQVDMPPAWAKSALQAMERALEKAVQA